MKLKNEDGEFEIFAPLAKNKSDNFIDLHV